VLQIIKYLRSSDDTVFVAKLYRVRN